MYSKIEELTEVEINKRRRALAKELEVKTADIKYDGDGQVFRDGSREYMVLTDEEADAGVLESVRGSAWAFNASFILSFCGLDQSGAKSLESMQSAKCEGANDFILSLIEKEEGGLATFAEEAASVDGRGHFLSSYDGAELDLYDSKGKGRYYGYRTN